MTLGRIFSFEFGYQARRATTWLVALAVFLVGWSVIQANYADDARNGFMWINAPLVIASTTVVCCLLWLFVGAAVAGEAAARDVESGMHPLTFSAPVPKRTFLAGRFLAAFATNALVLLASTAGILFGMAWPALEPEIFGPWRPQAFVLAYLVIALPNAFIATAVQFAFAALGRRAVLAYFGSVVLFFASMGLAAFVAAGLQRQDLAQLLDPVGMIVVVSHLSDTWTPAQHNLNMVGLQPTLLANRLVWIAVGIAVFAFTHWRFRLAHPAEGRRARKRREKAATQAAQPVRAADLRPAIPPVAPRNFRLAGQFRQLLAIAGRSLRTVARGWTVLGPMAVVLFITVVAVSTRQEFFGVPMIPRTEHVLTFLTASIASPGNKVWMILPLLVVFYAGELVWRERDARLGEIAGAAPVPEWVAFAGRFLALAVLVFGWMLVLVGAGMLSQAVHGYQQFEPGVYAKVILGLQFTDYLLFGLLALAVHTLVNHKQLGTLLALVVYGAIAFAPLLGLEHNLLVFGAGPAWTYSDARGFGPSLLPWWLFKAYWMAWAVLLAVLARLAWVRGRETAWRARLATARGRLTRATWTAAGLAGLAVLGLGGTIFYNTNVLNRYRPAAVVVAAKAEYERRYSRHADLPQPRIAHAALRVELYPQRRAADFVGHYRLENTYPQPIDTVHVATSTATGTRTQGLRFDRPTRLVLADDALGHRTYRLATPLRQGESLRMDFDVRLAPRGFGNRGADDTVVANGSWVDSAPFLPAIGYQRSRELREAGDRLTQHLPARPLVPKLEDATARRGLPGDVGMSYEATVGTSGDQIAITTGELLRSWRAGDRRYFQYASDSLVGEQVQFFSARYATRRERCEGVDVEVSYHPTHGNVVPSMVRGACAALALYGRIYGPYPHRTLRLVENAWRNIGAHSEPGLVDYGDGFALLAPDTSSGGFGFDLVFAVTAHEVAHQWWGGLRLTPARVEGVGFLVESMATYSATQVLADTLGPAQRDAYLDQMRQEYKVPRPQAMPPLLRATEQFLNYRKGPLALHALSQYIGRDAVNVALRRFLDTHPAGAATLPTSLDLFRELKAATPTRYQPLLHDLFTTNTYWELAAGEATARPRPDGRWDLTLELRARKFDVDAAGAEHPRELDEWVEVGVYPGPAQRTEGMEVVPGKPMYLRRHHLTAARQTITVTLPKEPGHAGVDPRSLLVDLRQRDNFVDVTKDKP